MFCPCPNFRTSSFILSILFLLSSANLIPQVSNDTGQDAFSVQNLHGRFGQVRSSDRTQIGSKLTFVSRARDSEEYSDCKLICGTHEFKLHKIILMTQSEYFRSAFKKGAFKVRMLYNRLENECCVNML